MVMVEVRSNKYKASTLRRLPIEYNKILQITPIFSTNLHRLGGK
jgi:hypothetical protein